MNDSVVSDPSPDDPFAANPTHRSVYNVTLRND